MTTHLTTRKENKLQLNGNLLTGDTYPVKDYIKAHLAGKWDGAAKGWRVDVGKLNTIVAAMSSHIGLRIDREAPSAPAASNGLCPKCHSYCYGDCSAH